MTILRDRRIAALLAAELVSSTGSQMTGLALPWFVLVTTGSASRMAWVVATEIAAMGLVGILSGPYATRLGARRTLLVCDALRAPLVAAIPLLHAAGALSFPVLLLLVFAFGSFATPSFSAQAAIVPEVVGTDPRRVGKAAALFQGTNRTTILLGPVIGGILIGLIGATNVLYLDAASYLVSVTLVAAFVPSTPRRPADAPGASDIWAGARFMLGDPLFRGWALSMPLIELCWQALFVSLPFLVYSEYDRDPHLLGLMFGAFGAGAVVGSVVVYKLLDHVAPLTIAIVGIVCQTLPLFALALPAPAWVAVAALFGSGFFNPVVNAAAGGIRASRTPPELMQQTAAFSITTSGICSPIGVLVAGPALVAFGARPVLLGIVCVQACGVAAWALAGVSARAAGLVPDTIEVAT